MFSKAALFLKEIHDIKKWNNGTHVKQQSHDFRAILQLAIFCTIFLWHNSPLQQEGRSVYYDTIKLIR